MKNVTLSGLILISLLIAACKQEDPENAYSPHPIAPPLNTNFSDSPVFLVAGQSNSASKADMHADAWSETGLVTINDYYHGNGMRIPTEIDPMDGGIAWIKLGDLLNRDVTFVSVGEGGTHSNQWVNNYPYDGNPTGLYGLFEKRILPQLNSRQFDAILWVQGESDYILGFMTSEEQSYQNILKMIIWSHKVQPNITWFIAKTSGVTDDFNTPIRRAQQRLIDEGFAYAGPDLDQIRLDYNCSIDLTGECLDQHGIEWFSILKRFF